MTEEFVSFDSATSTYRATYSLDNPNSVAETVVFGVAEITNADPASLPPLGLSVDTDALGSLFRPDGDSCSTVSVSFEYNGVTVTVRGDETITFRASD